MFLKPKLQSSCMVIGEHLGLKSYYTESAAPHFLSAKYNARYWRDGRMHAAVNGAHKVQYTLNGLSLS